MNLWNKLVLGTKFLTGGFESATDYLLKLLNKFIGSGDIATRIQQVRDYAVSILAYLKKYEKYCPAIWAEDFKKLQAVIQVLIDTFEDGKVSSAEIEKAIASVKDAIDEWMK